MALVQRVSQEAGPGFGVQVAADDEGENRPKSMTDWKGWSGCAKPKPGGGWEGGD